MLIKDFLTSQLIHVSMVTGLDLPGFLGGSNFLLPWDVTVRAEKDKWPAIGEVVGKKSKQKRAKQGTSYQAESECFVSFLCGIWHTKVNADWSYKSSP